MSSYNEYRPGWQKTPAKASNSTVAQRQDEARANEWGVRKLAPRANKPSPLLEEFMIKQGIPVK